jgi:error-prone DNA polymerase
MRNSESLALGRILAVSCYYTIMPSTPYIELHARSAFSFLRAASTPETLAATAAQLGIPALAICDRDGVYGSPRLHAAGREHGVRAIVGAELTMEDGCVVPVLVTSRTGYQNLCRLITEAKLRGTKTECAVTWAELPQYSEGLIALTGDEEGVLSAHILEGAAPTGPHSPGSRRYSSHPQNGGTTAACPPERCAQRRESSVVSKSRTGPSSVPSATAGRRSRSLQSSAASRPTNAAAALDRLVDAFGKSNVFVELQRHLVRGEEWCNDRRVELARAHRLPIVATNGVLHAAPPARSVLDLFTCVRNHTTFDGAGRLLSMNAERHLKTDAQMRALFRDLPEAIDNTARIADRIEFSLENLGYEFPKYQVPPGETMDSFLRKITFAGARARYSHLSRKILKQLEFELDLIARLGFSGYFIIVWDIANFCSENNILMQGRGSAANSAVCYSLGITACDPIANKLLFERFLSEGRKSWPDIDLDLPSGDRREQVIQEVYRRYGKHGAAMTANVITYRGKSAMREIGKALGFSNDILQRLSSLFGNGDYPHTLDMPAQMRQAGITMDHPRAEAAIRLYKKVYGLPRHLGQHSGGMIICQGALSSVVPLENASMPGRVVAQWDKDDCEDLGIIKVDLLGLGMMAAMQDAVELCQERGHPVDLASIPKDDTAVYDMMCRADTVGTFQVESRAQMASLPRMKPRCFYDVVMQVAIIRPGPIQGGMLQPLYARRDGEPFAYLDERLRDTLERTYGIPLFQEQLLKMSMIMADFSGSEAEELRRALSFHRSHERMDKVCVKLRRAMAEKGVKQEIADKIVQFVQSFAVYGFPESHAISFALIAYASCWMKVHRAPEFYCSLLNNQPMGFYNVATVIRDAKEHRVPMRPVSVLFSDWNCTIEADDSVRLGLRMVRGVNETFGRRIENERATHPFVALEDFRQRTTPDRDVLRTLARLGALNGLVDHRRDGLWKVERPLRETDLPRVAEEPPGTTSPLAPMTAFQRLEADFTSMGATTGRHPMALVRDQLRGRTLTARALLDVADGANVCVTGQVICRQRPSTAKGILFVSLEDETGVANAIVSPQLFEQRRMTIVQEAFLTIWGRAQKRHGSVHIQVRRVEEFRYENFTAAGSHDFR